MRNAWRLFVGDLKRLRSNVITGIVVLGLIALPSLFSWFNMLACWDVIDNTGNLTVAVANSDEGYESDLTPIRVNIGENVMSALRENEQMNWYFTTEEDAVEGVRAGRYYAAVVIPATFSRDMMSFYSDDVEHAAIIYYSNEKKSAIAPRVTDQGADQIVAQVNRTFAETLGSTALSIVSALSDYADNADASGRIAALGAHVQAAGEQMSHAASTLRAYADMLSLSRQLVVSTGSLVSTAQQSGDEIAGRIAEARSAAESGRSMRTPSAEVKVPPTMWNMRTRRRTVIQGTAARNGRSQAGPVRQTPCVLSGFQFHWLICAPSPCAPQSIRRHGSPPPQGPWICGRAARRASRT